jgi:two-component system alkaline phosphatase synthesis response regulator PhoP/two-component system response regulator VicR
MAEEQQEQTTKKNKIIIIDDERDLVRNIKEYFELFGYECLTAYDGNEGLHKIEKERPQLMLLDILMPSLDGYSMLGYIRKRNIPIKCIVMTAKSKLKDLFVLEHIDMFLTKPFDLAQLKKTVDELLAR